MDNQIGIAKQSLEQKAEANKSSTTGHWSLTPDDWKAAAEARGALSKVAPSAFPLPYVLLDSKVDSRCFTNPTITTESTNLKNSVSASNDGQDLASGRTLDGSIQTPAQRDAEVVFYSRTAREIFPNSEDARNAAYRVGMNEAGVDNYSQSFFKDKAKVDALKPGLTKSLVELAACRKDYREMQK
jgi:hypothetical protein